MADDPKDAAQAVLDSCGIEPGQVYRHHKGGLYSIVAVGIKEDTLEPMVVYQSNLKGTTWIRTLANFTETIEYLPYTLRKSCPRFIREED